MTKAKARVSQKPTAEQVKALSASGDYIRSMYSASSRKVAPDLSAGFTMNAEQGYINLGVDQLRAHSAAISALQDAYAKLDDLSPRQVARELEAAMWKAVDLVARSTSSFDDRLTTALKGLHAVLTRPAVPYDCWVLVAGLDPKRGLRMGSVVLRRFGRAHEKALGVGAGLKKSYIIDAKNLAKDRMVAEVRVLARDEAGARVLARNEVRRATDAINFFRPALKFSQGWAHLPEEAATTNIFSFVRLSSAPTGSIEYSVKGPFPNMKPRELRRGNVRLWQAASALLRVARSGNVAGLVATAIQWVGRAEAEPRREAAFLLNAIALEALLLPIQEVELNYRLSLRVARVLGGSKDERAQIVAQTKRLYGVRSKIVHSGSFTVTALELAELNSLAVAVIVRTLRRRSLWLKSRKAWDVHLERTVL